MMFMRKWFGDGFYESMLRRNFGRSIASSSREASLKIIRKLLVCGLVLLHMPAVLAQPAAEIPRRFRSGAHARRRRLARGSRS